MPKTYILGISAFYHDSAAALICEGEIIAAAHEERFTRKKHDDSFPQQAINYCLKEAGIEGKDISTVVFYEKPFLKFERLMTNVLATWPRGFNQYIKAIPLWLKQKLWLRSDISKKLGIPKTQIYFTTHHLSHAASSYFTSPFQDAAILTVDGTGEMATTMISKGEGNKLTPLLEIGFPHSLGLLYSTLTGYLGFKVNSAEYKVMGLAPYGKDSFHEEMRKLVEVFDDGSIRLNMKYFAFDRGLKMHSTALEKLFGGPARESESNLGQREFDIAHSLQVLTNEIMLKLAQKAKEVTGSSNLCLAGGVALNCVANEVVLKSGIFKNMYIQPASGDAGGALGAALQYWYRDHNFSGMDFFSPYLGPQFSREDIQDFLDKRQIAYQDLGDDENCCTTVAKLIDGINVIGWFQGRMEFGPRALGNRSILADARRAENWQRVNLKIKFRESFRPFAPTVMEEKREEYFDIQVHSPYMLLTAPVKVKDFPAITHVDNSARLQSVSKTENPKYHRLLEKYLAQSGVGCFINTSFNVRSEPIVCTPQDAFNVFINTDMDYLVLGNFLIAKKENLKFIDEISQARYLQQFELD
ncbi:MAG TPA: carbamoyltransferase [Candidatus Gracilibacteria bacterium]|nr:carbamoyltransferase [Candidatus Gracilibacteria bacterium]